MPTIRVVVRFRPINSREKRTAEDNNWSGKEICPLYVDEKHLLEFGEDCPEEEKVGKQVRCAPPGLERKLHPRFAFDEILVWVNQQTAFERIGLPVVTDALNGINGTIFAYGQTGSGKTFSMFGPEPLTENNSNLLGVIPRSCAHLFTSLSSDPNVKAYRIDVSFFEIYIHNAIRDLLHPAKKGDPPLKVRDGPKGVFIEHLKPETATNLTEILSLIALANSHRTVSSTKMNATSSRSHSVMKVGIRIERKDGSRCKSEINFGDLAGSEKVNKTGATGQTLREAQAINQSLTMLGNVIAALAKIGSGKKKSGSMVPFRDSALTHVLKDSLSGNCKTTLVTAASPHKFNIVETISTFRFGSRCKLVKTKAEKNVVLSPAQMRKMIASLKTEIKSLKMQVLKGGGGGGMGSSLSGIGVKITWPNDFQPWTTDKKVYDVLKKQVDKQIKDVLQTSVATNSDDVANMPYVISMSEAGAKRKVIVQFHADEEEDGDYDRETCIKLSKKLAEEIGKVNKGSLETAMKGYKMAKMFSEASTQELKEEIERQKMQIKLLNEQYTTANAELQEKTREVIDLQQNIDNFDNVSVRSKTDIYGGIGGYGHVPNYTAMSGGGSMIKLPDLFSRKSNLRASSIFNGSVGSNSLRTTDLLSQLLHSKYEVLRSKRALQLLQVRYGSEQKKMAQLRYIISRMQAEFMDLKATSLVSKAVLTNVADVAGSVYEGATNGGGSKRNTGNTHDATGVLSLRDQISRTSITTGFLNEQDDDFIAGALDDIMNDMDDSDSGKRTSQSGATPALLRRLSTLSGAASDAQTPQPRSRSGSRGRSNSKQRRASAGHVKSASRSMVGQKASALGAYSFGKKKNNIRAQIFQSGDKSAKQFGKASASYLARQSVKHSKSMRKELLNDMIGASKGGVKSDDDDDELKMNLERRADEFVPKVDFTDSKKLWTGYDKDWIKKWKVEDVATWLKQIYEGRMRKYTKQFRKRKIDGKRLLDLQMPDLLDLGLIRTEASQILAFTNSIAYDVDDDDDFNGMFEDLDDFDGFFDDEDLDDFWNDEVPEMQNVATLKRNTNDVYEEEYEQNGGYWSQGEDEYKGGIHEQIDSGFAYVTDNQYRTNTSDRRFYDDPTMRLPDLMIEQLTQNELRLTQKLPIFNSKQDSDCTNFRRIKEYYHDYSQVLLLTLYGLLCNKIGLLNISEWNGLLNLAKARSEDEINQMNITSSSSYFDDHMVIINSFVDVYGIYSQYSDHDTGKLTSEGGTGFVVSLRQTAEEPSDLRDDEDGVEFFAGLRIDEMQKFGMRLPNSLWTLINNPLDIEFVYREIRKKCSQNITPDRLQSCIKEMGAQFIGENVVKQSIEEMSLDPNPTINLDIWIKRLFIKGYDNEQHASESVLNELIILNDELEMKYFKQHRLEMMAKSSVGSAGYDEDYGSLMPSDNDTSGRKKPMLDNRSGNWGNTSGYFDHLDFDDDYNDNEEKEVKWVPYYGNLNKLLHDVGRFGTSGECQGFSKRLPSSRFVASSVYNNKKTPIKACRLNSKACWTANYKDNPDSIHWIQIDLGKITTLFAVAIQGSAYKEEWVTKGILTVSDTYSPNGDGNDEWKKVQLAGMNQNKLSCKDKSTVQVYMFGRWIKARYVRLNISEYHNAPSVRWDLLFGDIDKDNIPSL